MIILIAIAIFIGEVLTGPASTAVESLSSDFPAESVRIPLDNGSRVHGWLAKGTQGGGVVLLVHSVRSNRLEMLSRGRFLNKQGYGVLLIDLQAHGETPGKRITFGLRESDDVEAAITFLHNTFPFERIGAIGVSLGAAAIVLSKHPQRLDAVVIESLHPTIEEAVENRLRLHLGEYGTILLPVVMAQLAFYLDTSINELDPISRIKELNAPLLMIAGSADQHTKVAETERLFAAAQHPKEVWIVPGAGHFNMHSYAGKEYEDHIFDFLDHYLRRRE
ncbi:MAG: alpha/beta fold hydrolase [Nitrosomonadaceae bacterium]